MLSNASSSAWLILFAFVAGSVNAAPLQLDRRGASTVGKAMDDLLGALKATPVDASSLSRESGNTAIQLSKGFHGMTDEAWNGLSEGQKADAISKSSAATGAVLGMGTGVPVGAMEGAKKGLLAGGVTGGVLGAGAVGSVALPVLTGVAVDRHAKKEDNKRLKAQLEQQKQQVQDSQVASSFGGLPQGVRSVTVLSRRDEGLGDDDDEEENDDDDDDLN